MRKFRPNRRDGGKNSPSNGERSEWAFRALQYFKQRVGESGKIGEEDIQDLLTDMLHLAHQAGYPIIEPEDFEKMTRMAYTNFEAEM